jgi:NAD(P)H-hydrate epimerase
MKIFSAEQIKRWDTHTIEEEKIASVDLMERAARRCVQWLDLHYPLTKTQRLFRIFCGQGNNGGDGLAIARMLIKEKCRVQVLLCESSHRKSDDFRINLTRLEHLKGDINIITASESFPAIHKDDLIIDALLGTGLNKPIEGLMADTVNHINRSGCEVISVDIPSGMFCDRSSMGLPMIHAKHTLSFSDKLCFMMAENEPFTGKLHAIDIGASRLFLKEEASKMYITEREEAKSLILPRPQFGHKGTFGSGALLAGSYGMMGAAILAAKGFLHSGAGKLTCCIPTCGYTIMQAAVPEAMCLITGENVQETPDLPKGLNAIGVGPGIGVHEQYKKILETLFESGQPLVLDADALNMLGSYRTLIPRLPSGSVITPHPKEFENIFGKAGNDFERLNMAIRSAGELQIHIVLKGHRTAIISPEGNVHFNSTGNPGMAKPGSGDVLTGLLTGMLAQGYTAENACILGVYLHGLAGDIAAGIQAEQAITAMDIAECLGKAWKDMLN